MSTFTSVLLAQLMVIEKHTSQDLAFNCRPPECNDCTPTNMRLDARGRRSRLDARSRRSRLDARATDGAPHLGELFEIISSRTSQ